MPSPARAPCVEVSSIVATVGHTGNPGNTRHDYVPPLNNETLFRRDAYLCMYCARALSTAASCRAITCARSARAGAMSGPTWSRPAAAATTSRPGARPSRRRLQLIAVPFTADLRRIHLSQGPARAGRPDGVPAGAFSAQQPAARAHRTLAQLAAVRAWSIWSTRRCTYSVPGMRSAPISVTATAIPPTRCTDSRASSAI